MGHFSNTSRTGVFRLTENLLRQVMQNSDTFMANWIASRGNYFQCHEYLKTRGWDFDGDTRPYPGYPYYCDKKAREYFHIHPLRWVFKGCRCLFKTGENRHLRSKTRGIDIFHSTYFALPTPTKDKRITRFLTVYDLIPFLYPQFFTWKNIRQVKQAIASLAPSDFVICISESTRNDFCNRVKFDPNRVFVIPPAAAESFTPCRDPRQIKEARDKYHIPEGHYILSVATLEPRKNLKQLIAAYRQVVEQEKAKDLHLVLIGAKSPLYNRMVAEIQIPNQMKERIIFTGYVPDSDLTPLYSGALVFVYLSFYEGFGLPVLEAMQCGTPVITSNTSSLPEVVGDAGIMTSPHDIETISQGIMEIYRSGTLREKLSAQSLRQAEKFNWEKCFRQTGDAYRKALDMNGTTA